MENGIIYITDLAGLVVSGLPETPVPISARDVDTLMTANEAVLALLTALKAVIDAENRYKDSHSDERWSDEEMAARKRKARDTGLALIKLVEHDVVEPEMKGER